MARHVVVSFDDNEEADEFIKALGVEGSVFFHGALGNFKNADPKKVRVIGLFAKPTKFCQCRYTEEPKMVRSKNYGWYLHKDCNMPIAGHYQSALKNLLEPANIDPRKRGIFLGVREGETRWPEPRSAKEVK
jgi:hypothetical protein